MRRGDHARLGALRPFRADRVELLLLEHAQQLGLKIRRRVADLVEEDRAPPGEREPAAARRHRARERAAGVAEQLDSSSAGGSAVQFTATNGSDVAFDCS